MAALQQALLAAGGIVATTQTDTFATNTLADYYGGYADSPPTWSISGGILTATSSNQALLTRIAGSPTSITDGTISCVMTESEDAGLALRVTSGTSYYVAVVRDGSNSGSPNSANIYRRSGGFTQIGSTSTGVISWTRGTPHVVEFTIAGTALTLKVDGVTVVSTTDSALSAGGSFGMRVNGIGPNKFDSFTWPV